MPLHRFLAAQLDEFDIIIAGGGSAGCIVAARLAQADGGLSILLIEGGKNNYQEPNVVHPIFMLEHQRPDSTTAIFYKAKKAKQLADRQPVVPAGGVLGGGSSVNYMVYARAQRCDYDSWETPGWSTDEVIPFLQRIENYQDINGRNSQVHGLRGPVQVSRGPYTNEESSQFLDAAAKIGFRTDIDDLQDLDSNNGFSLWNRYVSPLGRRQDTAHAYLHPLLQSGEYPNLHVLVESQVVRVLFDGDKRASGVEYIPNPSFQEATEKRTVAARKLVVLSCGACGSPPVLERSGVGNPEILRMAGVEPVAEIEGVGNGYQDHQVTFFPYRTSLSPEKTMDAINSGRLSRSDAIAEGGPRLGWNGIDVVGKIRPTNEEAAALGPNFKAAWDKDFKDCPNRPLMLMIMVYAYFGGDSVPAAGQYVSAQLLTAYPYSRGSIHITGPEISDPLDFDVGFLTDPTGVDLKMQLWAYKKQRELMRRTKLYRGEVVEAHPRFAAGSSAACAELDLGEEYLGDCIEDIVYSAEDDQAIEEYLRRHIDTCWHSLGTAKMAALEDLGVVDADLNVHGVTGLKVIDNSIAPKNVGANTNNTALMIGEKGAAIIAKELGLSYF